MSLKNRSQSWLTQLFGSRTGRYRPTRRKLAAETLECRTVLSVAPLGDDPSLADYVAEIHDMGPLEPPAEIGTGDGGEPSYPDPAIGEGEGECDEFCNGNGTGIVETGGGGQQNAPPTIAGLGVEDLGEEILIWGEVSDEDPDGCEIEFFGLVEGTADVDQDGHFSLRVPKPTATGDIIAIATDALDTPSEEYHHFYDGE